MQLHGVFVVERAETVELVVEPFSVVSWISRAVVQNAFACHLIILELALVIGLILEDELAWALLLAVEGHSLVSPSVFVGLNGEDSVFLVFLAHVHVLHGRNLVSIASVLSFSHVLRGRSGVLDLELVIDGL